MMRKATVVIKEFYENHGGIETVAYLENAFEVSYTLPADDLYTCSFKLPGDDPKAAYITDTCLIEIWDNGERVELFKIDGKIEVSDDKGYTLAVTGTHVRKILREKALFSIHQIPGKSIGDVIRELLATPDENGQRKQKEWALSPDFDEHLRDLVIDYAFENSDIDSALWSLTENWETPTMWTYDTTVYPFRINLQAASRAETSIIRRGHNLTSISIEKPINTVANRIYALGSGEGINQVSIMNAEDLETDPTGGTLNGHHYVEDTASIEHYGVIEDYHIDRSISEPSLLLMGAKSTLQDYKYAKPVIQVQAVDLYPTTKLPQDHFVIGQGCRIIDQETGLNDVYRILCISKPDVTGAPGKITLTLGDMPNTLSGTLNRLYRRDNSDKVNAQGATNIWSRPFADNADADHPIQFKFRLPEDLLYVNKMILDIDVEHFRAYETGQAGGGGNVETSSATLVTNQSSRTSSASGGSTTITAGTSAATSGQESTTYSYSYPPGSEFAVKTKTKWSYHNNDPAKRDMEPSATHSDEPDRLFSGGFIYPSDIADVVGLPEQEGSTFVPVIMYQHEHPHTHTVEIPEHSHIIKSHTHGIEHTHTIPGHTHRIDEHTHAIEYGIHEEPSLPVSAVRVQIDDIDVPNVGAGLTYTGIDLLKIIPKDRNGRISRERHTLTITPVADTKDGKALCRITGELFIQCFVQSRGDYSI